jgi:hypothetical protein
MGDYPGLDLGSKSCHIPAPTGRRKGARLHQVAAGVAVLFQVVFVCAQIEPALGCLIPPTEMSGWVAPARGGIEERAIDADRSGFAGLDHITAAESERCGVLVIPRECSQMIEILFLRPWITDGAVVVSVVVREPTTEMTTSRIGIPRNEKLYLPSWRLASINGRDTSLPILQQRKFEVLDAEVWPKLPLGSFLGIAHKVVRSKIEADCCAKQTEREQTQQNLSNSIWITKPVFPPLYKWLFVTGLFFGLVSIVCVAVPHWFWLPSFAIGILLIAISFFLAPANRRSENVLIHPIVIAELKLRNIERQILGTDFVERADNTALQNRPEAFNRIRVDRSNNTMLGVLALGVINDAVRIAIVKAAIGGVVIRAEQANAIGNGFFDERFYRIAFSVFNDAGDHVAFALHSTNHDLFAEAAPLIVLALIPMPVLILAANIGLVDFNNAAELFDVFDKRGSDFVAHSPCRFVAPEPHVTHDLQCAHSLFGSEHEMNDLEPLAEGLVGVLEDSPGDVGEPIASLWSAMITLPMPRIALQLSRADCTTARTRDAIGPATANQIGAASIFVREHALKVGSGQLVDRFRSTGHDGYPLSVGGYCHA